jgi:death-on-curing protein
MRHVTLGEVVELHRRLLKATGGAPGIRDFGALESAVAQPKATFCGSDLYSTLAEKAAALCLALVQGPPFVDGNKRAGHAAMETFLVLNGSEIDAPTDAQERIMLDLATGGLDRSPPAHRLAPSASQNAQLILSVQRSQ